MTKLTPLQERYFFSRIKEIEDFEKSKTFPFHGLHNFMYQSCFPSEDFLLEGWKNNVFPSKTETQWALGYDDGIVAYSDVCFGSMYEAKNEIVDGLKKFYWRIYHTKGLKDERYLSFILDEKKSPWRLAIPYCKFHFKDKDKSPSSLYMLEFDPNTAPIQLVMSFIWGIRMIYEHPNQILLWNRMVDEGGLSEVQALHITSFVYQDVNTNSLMIGFDSGHVPWYNKTNSVLFDRLKNGTPYYSSASFSELKTYKGAIEIFSKSRPDYTLNIFNYYPWFKPSNSKYVGSFMARFKNVHNNSEEFKSNISCNLGSIEQVAKMYRSNKEWV